MPQKRLKVTYSTTKCIVAKHTAETLNPTLRALNYGHHGPFLILGIGKALLPQEAREIEG